MGLAASQLALGITLLFNSATCVASTTSLCQAVFLTQLLYKGTLMVGWLPSEFSKDPYVDAAPAVVAPVVQPLLEEASPPPARRRVRVTRNRATSSANPAANSPILAAVASTGRNEGPPDDHRMDMGIEMVPVNN